jgi:thiol-disulfide isomerase/thioredoxin
LWIRFSVLALAAGCLCHARRRHRTDECRSFRHHDPWPGHHCPEEPSQAPAAAGILPAARRKPAPTLRVTTFNGRTVTLDGFRGRPVVVSFFESWCGTCQVEQPDLTKVAAEIARQAGFVGISSHDTVAADLAYQRRFKVPYPLANDPSGKTWACWACHTSRSSC